MCSSHSSWFSARLIRNIGEFGAKKYFIDHQTANTIQLFVSIKRKFIGPLLFQNKLQQREFPSSYLINIYSHLFICISLKWTLSSGQKPVYIVHILISGQTAFSAVLYFGEVFAILTGIGDISISTLTNQPLYYSR